MQVIITYDGQGERLAAERLAATLRYQIPDPVIVRPSTIYGAHRASFTT